MDIVEWLRRNRPTYGWPEGRYVIVEPTMIHAAADEIERLREALYDIQDMPEDWELDEEMNLLFVIDTHVRIAKEALGITEEKE